MGHPEHVSEPRMPRNRLRRAAGIAPWGVTPKAARGEPFPGVT